MGICLDTDRKDDINEDPLQNQRQEEEKDLLAATASQLQIQEDGDNVTPVNKVSMDEFDFIRVVGRGSFGKVMLVMYKPNGKLYAMKVLRKEAIEKRKQKVHTRHEREILESVRHPFIVQLHFAFQTPTKLYLITDFMIGGELFFHLRRSFKFNEERSKFYAAELVLALEYLHGKGIIYRDLKPENILIGEDGHLKITDFGLSKIDIHEGDKTNTFCGTPEYLAPEILLAKGHDKSVDWWSLGALLYEMLSGAPPFYSKDKTLMFKNRLEKPIDMKPWFSPNAISLLQSLLCNDPRYRLGNQGSHQIKTHAFFLEIDWEELSQKKIDPPFKPKVSNARDLRHFDPMFTDEPAVDTPVQCEIGKEDKYEKFTYQRNNDDLESTTGKKNNNIEINHNFKLNSADKQRSSQKS